MKYVLYQLVKTYGYLKLSYFNGTLILAILQAWVKYIANHFSSFTESFDEILLIHAYKLPINT